MPTPSHSLRSSFWAAALLATAAAAAIVVFATRTRTTDPPTSHAAAGPTRDLLLLISGDTQGWIVPCGCASNQSGGLLRRASLVDQRRKSGDVVVLDVGGASGGTAPYQRAKFEAILRGERLMGLAAHNIGEVEAQLGLDELQRLSAATGVTFLSANARDAAGRPLGEPHRLVEAAGRRLLVVGVLSPRYASGEVRVSAPKDAVLSILESATPDHDALVVLAWLPEDELRQLARELPEAALIIGGPTGQAVAPEPIGPVLVGAATKKGKFLIELTAPSAPDSKWTGRVLEVSSDHADHPDQVANLREFRQRLDAEDFAASQTGFAVTLPEPVPVGFSIAGTQSCRECHADDCTVWDESPHAHAWDTLVADGAHVDSFCQQCHTTGFGLPDGFVSTRRSAPPGVGRNSIPSTLDPRRASADVPTPEAEVELLRASHDRTQVGCESCHGPSQAHVADPGKRTTFAARDRCLSCHDRENSPEFDFESYWQQIVHGRKVVAHD